MASDDRPATPSAIRDLIVRQLALCLVDKWRKEHSQNGADDQDGRA